MIAPEEYGGSLLSPTEHIYSGCTLICGASGMYGFQPKNRRRTIARITENLHIGEHGGGATRHLEFLGFCGAKAADWADLLETWADSHRSLMAGDL